MPVCTACGKRSLFGSGWSPTLSNINMERSYKDTYHTRTNYCPECRDVFRRIAEFIADDFGSVFIPEGHQFEIQQSKEAAFIVQKAREYCLARKFNTRDNRYEMYYAILHYIGGGATAQDIDDIVQNSPDFKQVLLDGCITH